jgi:hypothetical protein
MARVGLIHLRILYPISKHQKRKELIIIHQIAIENDYRAINPYMNISVPNIISQDTTARKKIWATFTYTGKETRFIVTLFKNTNIKIMFRT